MSSVQTTHWAGRNMSSVGSTSVPCHPSGPVKRQLTQSMQVSFCNWLINKLIWHSHCQTADASPPGETPRLPVAVAAPEPVPGHLLPVRDIVQLAWHVVLVVRGPTSRVWSTFLLKKQQCSRSLQGVSLASLAYPLLWLLQNLSLDISGQSCTLCRLPGTWCMLLEALLHGSGRDIGLQGSNHTFGVALMPVRLHRGSSASPAGAWRTPLGPPWWGWTLCKLLKGSTSWIWRPL